MSSAWLVTKTYPNAVEPTMLRVVERDAPAGELPILTQRGRVLVRIANTPKAKWAVQ
ncbi:MAG TPA: hypothetical protein VGL39_04615 [Jatrophihabitantaceae bacterium]|jgi:hypothetical protein